MHDVVVAATGMVPFRKDVDVSVDLLAAAAVRALLWTSDFDPALIEEVHVGSAKGGGTPNSREYSRLH